MDRSILVDLHKNRKELDAVNKSICRLQKQLDNVPVVSGKVSSSSKEFPYVESHLTVEMKAPREADRLERRIIQKKSRKRILKSKIRAAEMFIENMPEGIEKDIFEMVYLEEMTQCEVAKFVGYTQARVSQIISGVLKDL